MPQENKMCIYCFDSDAAYFKGKEHVIPESFGKFGSETPTLDCVCDQCNKFFCGTLDNVLARDTLEGISRYKHGQFSRETRPQRRLKITLAEGAETGDLAGVAASIDGMTGNLLPLISADYKRGNPFNAPFLDNSEEAGRQSVAVVIEGEIDTLHKRAIAKILMNFVTFYIVRTDALKPRWDFLRRYVRNGEGEIKARISKKPFWTGQETDALRLSDDSINVRIENLEGDIVGTIQFYNQLTYEMILVEGDALSPDKEVAYRFTPGKVPTRGAKGRQLAK